jgi:hypothetical protein
MLSHLFETCGDKKSSHVKGWCGSGQVRSTGDFDGLDAPESWFIIHILVPHVTDKLTKKNKKLHSLESSTSFGFQLQMEGGFNALVSQTTT